MFICVSVLSEACRTGDHNIVSLFVRILNLDGMQCIRSFFIDTSVVVNVYQQVAQKQMLTFLGTEYGDAQLEFFLEAQKMIDLEGQAQQDAALKVYTQFVAAQGSGIGAQDRTKGTQELWDKCNKESGDTVDGATAVAIVTDEADKTLNMLAFDAFPRFLKSKYCQAVMDDLKKKSGGDVSCPYMLRTFSLGSSCRPWRSTHAIFS